MSEDTATQLETAVNALAVLSGTFHDGPKFGLVTLDLVAELATDGRGLLRLLIGMTGCGLAAHWHQGAGNRCRLRRHLGEVGPADTGPIPGAQ